MSSKPESVVVVGGGVVGLATAYYLQKAGIEVTVVDADEPGHGASWGNGGWLSPVLTIPTPAPGVPRMGIVESFQRTSAVTVRPHASPGMVPWLLRFLRHCTRSSFEEGARSLAALSAAMFDGFDELVDLGVPVDIPVRGNLRACLTEAEARHQLDQLAPMREAGYAVPGTVRTGSEMRELEPELSEHVRSGFDLPAERHVDPRALCGALATYLEKRGVTLLPGRRVTRVHKGGSRAVALETPEGTITADAYVIAAGLDSRELVRDVGGKLPLRAGKGYSFFVPTEHGPSRPLYLSHTKVGVTPLDGGYRVVGAMEIADESLRINQRVVRSMVDIVGRYVRNAPDPGGELSQLWAGLRPMTPDGLPVMGRLPALENVYVNAGHGMAGVGLSMVSGASTAQLVVGHERSSATAPFAVERF